MEASCSSSDSVSLVVVALSPLLLRDSRGPGPARVRPRWRSYCYRQLALGYSAVRYGLISSVLAAAAIAGSFAGQHLVTRIGVRRVAAAALVLAEVGATVMRRV
jgi:hypothetical protein